MCFIHTSHCQLYRLSYHISASLCAPILSRKLWGQPTFVAAAVFGKPGAQNWSRDVRSVQRQKNQLKIMKIMWNHEISSFRQYSDIFKQHKAATLLSSAWFQRPDHNLLTKPWTHWMDCRASPIMSCERTRHSLHSWDFHKVTIAKVQLKKYLHFQLSTNSGTSAMQFMSYLRRSAPEKIRRNQKQHVTFTTPRT